MSQLNAADVPTVFAVQVKEPLQPICSTVGPGRGRGRHLMPPGEQRPAQYPGQLPVVAKADWQEREAVPLQHATKGLPDGSKEFDANCSTHFLLLPAR